MSKRFYSGKTYTHNTGHSCAFRQWRATSHCNLIHGYALQFEFTFAGSDLDERNWIVDFGGLKPLKEWLKYMFDHTYLVAEDDPEMETVKMLQEKNLIDMRLVTATGCERFAEMAFDKADEIVKELTDGRCWVQKATVREHEANSGTVELADHQKMIFKQ
jgi:6-pyruvoyltetrahydropterin/6-carboxytetrahydropterin synthase|tara:strand:+ start:732 stop:1211 length:480 start_codon:yes stop_codon:yes gene_type:complete